jgi:hypothetical protein
MSSGWIEVTSREGALVWISLDDVTVIEKHREGSRIWFDEGDALEVKEKPEDVVSLLAAA